LYPLQDGVLNIFKKSNTPFFLTGGTALGRHYFNHRFSDDLDMFVNDDPHYPEQVDFVLNLFFAQLPSTGPVIIKESIRRFKDSALFFAVSPQWPDIQLKIDLVNDVAGRYGPLEWDPVLGKVDSWRNILSNKLSALFRFEPKDVADLWIIAKRKRFNWREIMREAKTKESGVEPDIVCNILRSFPVRQLELVKWIMPRPDLEEFAKDLAVIAKDILLGRSNTLYNPS